MTSLAIAPSTSTTLPAVSFHPHGHKKSSQISSGDADNDTAAQIPTSAAQSLFGNLLQTLESVIGVQTSLPASASAAVGANTSAAGVASAPGAGATPTAAATSAATANDASSGQNLANSAASSPQAKLRAAFEPSAQTLPGSNVNASA